MSKIIIHCTDAEGNLVDFESSPHKGDEAIANYGMYQGWLNEKGFTQIKKYTPKPKVVFDPSVTKVCPTCGFTMNPRQGTSKVGKPYKGWFCSNPEAQQKGCKPIWAQ